MDRFDKAFAAWFVFCTLVSLTLIGVGLWAIISLVQWVTAK